MSDAGRPGPRSETQVTIQLEDMPPHSELAKRIAVAGATARCHLEKLGYRNRLGLGSDIHVWGQAMCDIGEKQLTVIVFPWIWLDETECDMNDARLSSMLCYSPKSEIPM